jgi:hypothetical protein
MRSLILATTLAVTPLIGQAQTDSSKSRPADVGPGRVAWFDITTTDLAKSRSSTANSSTGSSIPFRELISQSRSWRRGRPSGR